MNNYKKLGVSALAGTLASLTAMQAANAGAIDVSGSIDLSYVGNDSDETTGNQYGMSKDFQMGGSGEMDNGYSWSYFANYADGTAGLTSITSAAFTMNLDTMGSITVSQGSGSAVSAIDDITPSAYEESWDSVGSTSGLNLVGGVNSGTVLRYQFPELPLGTTVKVAYNPDPGGSKSADGGSAVGTNAYGTGSDISIATGLGIDGLTLGAGYAQIEVLDGKTTSSTYSGDIDEMVAYVKYAAGPVTFGYFESYESTGLRAAASVDAYAANGFGISFAVNDNMSVSYSEVENTKEFGTVGQTDVTLETEGVALSYNLGGASLLIQHNELNRTWTAASATSDENTEIRLKMAF
jgi:outer membrane protein OmpU